MSVTVEVDVEDPDERVERFIDIAVRLVEQFADKNDDYGDSAFKTYKEWGLKSFAMRVGDKFRRFKELVRKREEDEEPNVDDESIYDTMEDGASYFIMALIAEEED